MRQISKTKETIIINSLINYLKEEKADIEVRLIETRGEFSQFMNTLFAYNDYL